METTVCGRNHAGEGALSGKGTLIKKEVQKRDCSKGEEEILHTLKRIGLTENIALCTSTGTEGRGGGPMKKTDLHEVE